MLLVDEVMCMVLTEEEFDATLCLQWNERDDNKRSAQFKDPNPGESKTEV